MSDSEGGGDLFGDEAGSAGSPDQVLSDQDLGSELDDGENRGRDHYQDRDEDIEDEDQEVKVKRIMGVTLHRHRVPRTSRDGFLQTLKIPSFLKLQAEEYKPDTYEATEWDIQNARSDKRKNVVRFTRDPETGELKSNALIYRWDDGSITMSVGTDHYEIQKKGMAPATDKPYEERDDSHYYVAAAHFTSELFVTVGHVNEQFSVIPPSDVKDEAILKFSRAMEEAARARKQGANMIFTTNKDPELQKREAEAAEKERMKAQRRRENASARMDSRALGSSVNYKTGLSINELEGRKGGSGRKRGAPGASRGKRRRPEYDSDDDFASGTHRRNEYDREDDFIASSDEEEEAGGDDDEEEEDILDDDEEEEEVPRKKRQKTAEAEEDADADADADLDDVDVPAPTGESSHRRRRHIIDDEDDDDE